MSNDWLAPILFAPRLYFLHHLARRSVQVIRQDFSDLPHTRFGAIQRGYPHGYLWGLDCRDSSLPDVALAVLAFVTSVQTLLCKATAHNPTLA
jgi:hypothetical protein